MGLKEKNNPLGQHVPSDHVGAVNPAFLHGQSAELVDQIREKAKKESAEAHAPKVSPENTPPDQPSGLSGLPSQK